MIPPPMGIPNLGFLKAKNATRTASNMGNGCGRMGKKVMPKPMANAVIIKVRYLSKEDSLFSSCLLFCFRLFIQGLIEESLVESFLSLIGFAGSVGIGIGLVSGFNSSLDGGDSTFISFSASVSASGSILD